MPLSKEDRRTALRALCKLELIELDYIENLYLMRDRFNTLHEDEKLLNLFDDRLRAYELGMQAACEKTAQLRENINHAERAFQTLSKHLQNMIDDRKTSTAICDRNIETDKT